MMPLLWFLLTLALVWAIGDRLICLRERRAHRRAVEDWCDG